MIMYWFPVRILHERKEDLLRLLSLMKDLHRDGAIKHEEFAQKEDECLRHLSALEWAIDELLKDEKEKVS